MRHLMNMPPNKLAKSPQCVALFDIFGKHLQLFENLFYISLNSQYGMLSAGGCFWGLELAYQRVPGVVKTSVGYTGGHDPTPNYNSVCSGRTGHAEAVQVQP